jgi:peptidyl-prolyl cis-trans isomerase C/foldase protein PrsA
MVVLTVNGEKIEEEALRLETAAMLKLMTERMPKESPAALRKQAREWAEENLIESALMRQAAANDPEPIDAPEGSSEEDILRLRMDRLVARITAPASPPRHKDVVAYYVKNRDSFPAPESIRAAHIVKNVDEKTTEAEARAGIEKAMEELKKGRRFPEVADELSDCPGNGGDLGYFERGQMVDAFEEVVFRMRPGDVSNIFRTEFGFHIALAIDYKEAGIRKLEEVQEQIAEQLLSEKKQKRLHQYVDNLKARARIVREEARA